MRRKSTQELSRGMTHAHFRLVTGLIVPRDETPGTQCDANKSRGWVDDRSIAVAECLRPLTVALAEDEERLNMVSTFNMVSTDSHMVST